MNWMQSKNIYRKLIFYEILSLFAITNFLMCSNCIFTLSFREYSYRFIYIPMYCTNLIVIFPEIAMIFYFSFSSRKKNKDTRFSRIVYDKFWGV